MAAEIPSLAFIMFRAGLRYVGHDPILSRVRLAVGTPQDGIMLKCSLADLDEKDIQRVIDTLGKTVTITLELPDGEAEDST